MDGRNLGPLFIEGLLLLFKLLRVAETGEFGAEFDLDDLDLLFEVSCLIIKCEPLLVMLLFVLALRDVFELLRLRFS
jgi:hypothetical protein